MKVLIWEEGGLGRGGVEEDKSLCCVAKDGADGPERLATLEASPQSHRG